MLQYFFFIIYEWAQQARVFVPGKPLQPSLLYVSKIGYPLYTLQHTNRPNKLESFITLGWKDLSEETLQLIVPFYSLL
jgi:hypothetical protein